MRHLMIAATLLVAAPSDDRPHGFGGDMHNEKIYNLADPTSDQDAATKFYVDNLLPVYDEFFVGDAASSDIAGYKQLTETVDVAQNTVSILGDSATKAIEEWATEPGVPGITEIQQGSLDLHFWAKVDSAGSTDCLYVVRGQVYVRTTVPVETQIGSDEDTATLGTGNTLYELHFHNTADLTINSTDRLVVKLIAVRTCGAPRVNDANVTITYGSAATSAHLSLPVNVVVLDNYVKKAGDTMTGNLTASGSVELDGWTLNNSKYTYDTVTCSSDAATVDFSTAEIWTVDFGDEGAAGCTVTFSNASANSSYFVTLVQDGDGGDYTFAGGTFKYAGKSKPTLTATDNAEDDFSIVTRGSTEFRISYQQDVGAP